MIFDRADDLRNGIGNNWKIKKTLKNRTVFTVFYEPSTRTRMSFDVAVKRLGGNVITTENAKDFSSAIKGETLEDTVRVLCEYRPDIIVLRHHETGAAERAAAVSSVPIINAGDGRGQHPTQALLDMYTIRRHFTSLNGLTILIGGDLANGRTARSLIYLFSKFCPETRFIFISPDELRLGDDMKNHLTEHNIQFRESRELKPNLEFADVVYWTRIQKERLTNVRYEDVADQFMLGRTELKLMESNAIIMHPLPRVNEIQTEVDSDPRAVYFEQAGNGMYIRMALMEWVLNIF